MTNPIKLIYRWKPIERYETFVKSKHIPLTIILIIANILGGLIFGYALGTIGGGLSSATNAFFPSSSNSSSSSSNNTIIRSHSRVNVLVYNHHHHDNYLTNNNNNIKSSINVINPSSNAVDNINNIDEEEEQWMVATLFNLERLMNLFISAVESKISHYSMAEENSGLAGGHDPIDWGIKFKIRSFENVLDVNNINMMMENATLTTSSSSTTTDLSTTLLQGLFACSIFIGGLVGCLFSMLVTGSILGRKVSMICCCLISIVGAVGASASYTFASLIVFRCFIGVGAGISTTVSSMYVSELMPFAKYQGVLGGMYNLGVSLGVAFGYVIGAIFVRFDDCWRAVHAFHNLFCIALLLLVVFVIPESPQFLKEETKQEHSNNNSIELAAVVVEEDPKRTQPISPIVEKKEAEFAEVSKIKPQQQEGSKPLSTIAALKRLFCSKVLIQLMLGCYGCLALEWTGVQSATSFTPSLMASAGLTDQLDQQLASLGIAIWQVLCVFPTIFLIDRLGRRTIVLFGMTVCFFANVAEGFIFQFCETGTDYKIILAVIFICIFLLGFNVGIGSLCYVLAHEVFNGENEKVVMIGTSLSTLSMWITTIVLTLFFFPLVSVTNQAVPWFIFAGITLIGLLIYIFLLKETSPTILAKKRDAAEKKNKKLVDQAKTVDVAPLPPLKTVESEVVDHNNSQPFISTTNNCPPPASLTTSTSASGDAVVTCEQPISEKDVATTTTDDQTKVETEKETKQVL